MKVENVKSYVKETIHELVHEVTWPTWAQLQSSSIIVLVASIIISMIVFVMDYTFGINSVAEGESGWKGVLGFFYNTFN